MKAKRTQVRKILPASLLAGAAIIAVPGVACAAEGGMSLIIPSLYEFIPMLIAFIVVCIILAKFAWPVITGIVDRREEKIKDDIAKAEAARIEAEHLLADYKEQLEDAKKQAAEIVSDARTSAEALKADIDKQARAEAEALIARAKSTIETERQAAIADLQRSAAELSVAVAGRLISQDLSDDEHLKIVEHYVEEAGSFNAN